MELLFIVPLQPKSSTYLKFVYVILMMTSGLLSTVSTAWRNRHCAFPETIQDQFCNLFIYFVPISLQIQTLCCWNGQSRFYRWFTDVCRGERRRTVLSWLWKTARSPTQGPIWLCGEFIKFTIHIIFFMTYIGWLGSMLQEFEDYRDAQCAVFNLNGKELCGVRYTITIL